MQEEQPKKYSFLQKVITIRYLNHHVQRICHLDNKVKLKIYLDENNIHTYYRAYYEYLKANKRFTPHMEFKHIIGVYIFSCGINERLNFTHGTSFVIYSQIIAKYVLKDTRIINETIVL